MFAREGELTVTFTSHLMQMRFLSNRPVLSTQLNLLFVKHPDVLGFFWVPFASVSRLQHIFYTVWFMKSRGSSLSTENKATSYYAGNISSLFKRLLGKWKCFSGVGRYQMVVNGFIC